MPSTPASSPHPRGLGRPSRPLVTLAKITEAALHIASTAGYESLKMTTIATALGVRPSALYNHVASKQEVLLLIEDELMSKIRTDDLDGLPWEEALRLWATRYKDVFAEHTPLIPMVALIPVTDAARALEVYEAVARVLERSGMPAERIIPTLVAFESFIFGSAYDVNAPENIFAITDAAAAPRFAAFVAQSEAGSEGYRPDAAFQLGLDALIAAVRANSGVD